MIKYEIREICGDWGIFEMRWGANGWEDATEECLLILNSRSNAEYIKVILEHEDRHPNAAVPYRPDVADMSDEECLAVFRLCIEDGYHCDACPLACTEGCESYVDIERRVLAMAEERNRWIFKNCTFEMLDIAFKRLFPGVQYTAFYDCDIEDNEHGKKVSGVTNFAEDGDITILVDGTLQVNDAVEVFAHELAHAGVGGEHEHDEVWQKAFDDLFDEYNKIGDEMFSSKVTPPYTGEEYKNALDEFERRRKTDENISDREDLQGEQGDPSI